MTQNLKIRAYLMQNFMELDMKKFSDPTTLKFGVWGLKTNLGQFGPKAFDKRLLIKPLVKKRSSNFHKQDLMKNQQTTERRKKWITAMNRELAQIWRSKLTVLGLVAKILQQMLNQMILFI